jgi:hypothetical protein
MAPTSRHQSKLSAIHMLTLAQIEVDARDIGKKTTLSPVLKLSRRIQQYARAIAQQSDAPPCAGVPLAEIDDAGDRQRIGLLTNNQIIEALTAYIRQVESVPEASPIPEGSHTPAGDAQHARKAE